MEELKWEMCREECVCVCVIMGHEMWYTGVCSLWSSFRYH